MPVSYLYGYGPVTLSSTLPLPELVQVKGRRRPWLRVETAALDVHDIAWYQQWRRDTGEPWLGLGHLADGYLLRFAGVVDFSVSGRRICIDIAGGAHVSPLTLRHLLLDQVVPLALAHHGKTVLHGAAVATDVGAVGLIGTTGRGKSTLTTSFAAAGLCAITDDALLISVDPVEGVRVHPSYPSLRVWPEVAATVLSDEGRGAPRVSDWNEKLRVGPGNGLAFSTRPSPLRALYVLVPDDDAHEPSIERLAVGERVLELVRNAFVLEWGAGRDVRPRFERLVEVADRVPMRRLRFAKRFDQLQRVRTMILDDLKRQLP